MIPTSRVQSGETGVTNDTDAQIAQQLGIVRRTLARWKQRSVFAAAMAALGSGRTYPVQPGKPLRLERGCRGFLPAHGNEHQAIPAI